MPPTTWALAASAAAAMVASTTAFSYGGLQINPIDTPAYTYENAPFRCRQPSVNVDANGTHVRILVTSYSQMLTDEPPTSPVYGRSQYTFATFLNSVAYQNRSIWDPTVSALNPSLSSLFTNSVNLQSYNLVSPNDDDFLWMGTCNPGGATDTRYSKAANLTLAPPTLSAALATADLSDLTLSAAGCTCPTYAVAYDSGSQTTTVYDLTAKSEITNGVYPCPTVDETPGTSVTYFYSQTGNTFNGRAGATLPNQDGIMQSILTNRWNIRQTTCGATAGDSCVGAAFVGAAVSTPDNVQHTCSIKTEALLFLPMQQFVLQLGANDQALQTLTDGSLTTHTWSMYTVEYASTAPANYSLGQDKFQTRVTPHRFQLAVYPTGAVVQVRELEEESGVGGRVEKEL